MRSEYVFAATRGISNRFLLCRMTSISARRLHIGSKHTSETINQSLKLIADAELVPPINQATSNENCQAEPLVVAAAAD